MKYIICQICKKKIIRTGPAQKYCKDCSRKKKLEYLRNLMKFKRQTNQNNILEQEQEYRDKNKDKAKKRSNKHYQLHKKEIKHRSKMRRRNYKLKVFRYYSKGIPKCACCGETHIEFLCIDHIHGGGNKHRRKLQKHSTDYYRWFIKNNFPEGFQILCHNCNMAKGFFGYCPHEREKKLIGIEKFTIVKTKYMRDNQ